MSTNAGGLLGVLRGGAPAPQPLGQRQHGDAMGAEEITLLVEGLAKRREADGRAMAELRSRVRPCAPNLYILNPQL